MKPEDFLLIIHPMIAVVSVFPLVGIVTYFAWQTRQRRLQTLQGDKSKIPATVGRNHVLIGKWLSTVVVVVTLLGLAHPLGTNIISKQLWVTNSFQVVFIVLMFVLAIVSLIFLFVLDKSTGGGTFAILSGMAIVILGCQDGVFRRTNEWYWSHYYYGITVVLLMIFSLSIIEDIYQDRSNRWRYVHIILNCLALALFLGQGFTGTRDIFEIGLYMPPPQ